LPQGFAHSQRPIQVDDPRTALAAEARAVHANFWSQLSQQNDA
jgi:hypothetical protein